MLQQILSLIEQGRGGTQRQLAERLHVPETLVVQMIEELVRQGYLEEATMCAEGCEGCSLKAACGQTRELRLWAVTDKGRRAAGAAGG